ncbi:MAG TPA: HAMP domain-containing sensor histidine kinase [Nevskiaceae bacterium]|nr:HAMP domain-containing sensor histidine kinase [Nevskiaceae bacterium]
MNIKLPAFLKPTTLRLGLSYLAIIMVMSIGFSVVFYRAANRELTRQVPGPSFFSHAGPGISYGYNNFFEERLAEGRRHLLFNLIWLNLGALAVGAVISYGLARKALEPIEGAMEAQSRFASDASHELRTPLAIMQTENEVALRKPGLTLPRAKELLHSNLEEVTKLKALSDGLLRLTREEHVDLELKKIELPPIATEALNRILKPAQAKHITIADEIPHIQVMSDEPSLTQAITILLDNAIKYSGEGTTVHIKAWSRGQYAYVQVRDQGQGIAARDLPHIFERFYRADQSRSKQHVDGHGLGLSIAQKIIEQHHGEIGVQSTPGKGSTFLIKLPLAI